MTTCTCDLSIVVPVFDEVQCIGAFFERIVPVLDGLQRSWEIVVVDDGSRDDTPAVVGMRAQSDPRVRLIRAQHRGKGAAIRRGLFEAGGTWIFMVDVDLAMPPDNLSRFLAMADGNPCPDIVIGSREAPGARRLGEPWRRYLLGRLFNAVVRLLVLPGLKDTQCGFKLFRARALAGLLDCLTIDGFAFDVELLMLARRVGLDIREVGIVWEGDGESGVRLQEGVRAVADVLRLKFHHWYRT